jgi:hypothetical protein
MMALVTRLHDVDAADREQLMAAARGGVPRELDPAAPERRAA